MTINGNEAEYIIPSEFYLSQNYPNPVYEKTTIKYCLPFKTKVKIEVINSEGELVETLIDKEQKAGTYEIEFSAKGRPASNGIDGSLPEGKYFYTMKTEDKTNRICLVDKKELIYIKP